MTDSAISNLYELLLRGNSLNAVVAIVAACLLACLLMAERRKSTPLVLSFKSPLSMLFVATAIIQPHPVKSYYCWVLSGLVCGLVGDFCLALKGNRAFKAGLVAFLLGHILYVVAFAGLTRPFDWVTLGHLVILLASLGVFWWLRPHLGAMMVPVGLYVIVISLMIAAAWVAFLNPDLARNGAWALFIGALCFYASDVFVARERFGKSQFANRIVGLPLYYVGQFLIALSVGLV